MTGKPAFYSLGKPIPGAADSFSIRTLACGVINQAWVDLQYLGKWDKATRHAIQDARDFFLSESPDWARSRQDWCDIAGLNVERVQKSAREIVEAVRKIQTEAHRIYLVERRELREAAASRKQRRGRPVGVE